jgi:BirA family biotin operon repressor/biotin-[acetyl-CoA-carboxylase] ligase
MKLPRSESSAARLTVLAETTSTNDVLVASAADQPEFAVVVTGSQTSGRGRLGRVWVAPPGKSLAISVLLRPVHADGRALSLEHFGWLPLIAGAAMAKAITAVVPGTVGLKWPNDVQIDGLKVSGLLAELTPAGNAVVLGAGVNLALAADELPTPVSTSLLLAGAALEGDELADAVLSSYLDNLRSLYTDFLADGVDGALAVITSLCTTLGQRVRVELPSGVDLHGTATGIDRSGRLEVRSDEDGALVAVAAGDVTHLRYE